MLGLIKKDLCIIFSNFKVMAILLIAFIIMSFNNLEGIIFLPVFFSVMLSITTFSYDDFNHWNAYAITFPTGRKNIVKAKYLTSLILLISSIIITVFISILAGVSNHNLQIEEIISTTIGCVLALVIVLSILYPMIFKLGVEKGRMIFFLMVLILSLLLSYASESISLVLPEQLLAFLEQWWYFIIPIFSLIILFISYQISKRIYLKKEF